MAGKDGDPEDEVSLDPPEDEIDETEQQDETEAEEQEAEPEEGEVDAQSGESESRQSGEQQRQPSRRDRRIETLTASLAEERRAREETNRRLDALLAGRNQTQGETPEQREQRRALLDPEARIRDELQEARQAHARDMQNLQFAVVDGNDRAAFEAKATVDPLYEKWKPKVEAELAQLRSKGQTVEREKLMFYLIGQNAVAARKSAKPQRLAAERRVNSQRTRAPNSGSDVQANRRDRSTSLERRLENQAL